MSRVVRNEKTGKIDLLRVQGSVVQYPALLEPRGKEDLKEGTYGAQFIIKDPESIALVKEYVTQVAKEAITSMWGGKVPKGMTLPYFAGDEDNDIESGGIVLKTNSKFPPKVYIRRPGQRTVALDDNEEIYPGMIADADIKFKSYAHASGNKGVTAYIQAICKTGDGTPLYVSSAASFDIEDFDYADEDAEASSFDIDSLTGTAAGTPKKLPVNKNPEKKAPAPKVPAKKVVEAEDFNLENLELSSDSDDDFDIDDVGEGTTLEDLLK